LPAGEKLAADWEGHNIGLVGEVDCTSKWGKATCEMQEIFSFPTLMYGDPRNMEEYEGGKSYAELSAFAKENLVVPVCSVENVDPCNDESKTKIQQYEHMSFEELESLIDAEEAKVIAAKEEFENELERLQEMHDQAAMAKYEALAAVRRGGMPLMKAVLKAKKMSDSGSKTGSDDEL
jgi:hypothetical protein